jgi:NADH-quinone oxidoreductase subunit N
VLVGGIMMASFNNLSMLFLGVETLSISLYVLAGSRKELSSTEAAFKYLLMGSFATGILLFGIALVYGATGVLHMDAIATILSGSTDSLPAFFYVGIVLMLVGMLFKISAVPFHFWAPDVYSGSPTSVTAFMATVVKIAALAAFVRLFGVCFPAQYWQDIVLVITTLTLIIPNITAVYQDNVKRMLAYSSVGQVGFILLLFVSSPTATTGIFYYLFTYSVASLSTFNIVLMMESYGGNGLGNFNGLYKRNPLLAGIMAAGLMSLAGIPPFPGFFAKYFVFVEAMEAGYVYLVVVAILVSIVSVYYYFKVIIAMYWYSPPEIAGVKIPRQAQFYLIVSGIVLALLTLLPDQTISMIMP